MHVLDKMSGCKGNLVDTATESVPTFDHRHFKAVSQEDVGTTEPGEPRADDTDPGRAAEDLRTALVKM